MKVVGQNLWLQWRTRFRKCWFQPKAQRSKRLQKPETTNTVHSTHACSYQSIVVIVICSSNITIYKFCQKLLVFLTHRFSISEKKLQKRSQIALKYNNENGWPLKVRKHCHSGALGEHYMAVHYIAILQSFFLQSLWRQHQGSCGHPAWALSR